MSEENEHCPGCGDDMCQCHDAAEARIAEQQAEIERMEATNVMLQGWVVKLSTELAELRGDFEYVKQERDRFMFAQQGGEG